MQSPKQLGLALDTAPGGEIQRREAASAAVGDRGLRRVEPRQPLPITPAPLPPGQLFLSYTCGHRQSQAWCLGRLAATLPTKHVCLHERLHPASPGEAAWALASPGRAPPWSHTPAPGLGALPVNPGRSWAEGRGAKLAQGGGKGCGEDFPGPGAGEPHRAGPARVPACSAIPSGSRAEPRPHAQV